MIFIGISQLCNTTPSAREVPSFLSHHQTETIVQQVFVVCSPRLTFLFAFCTFNVQKKVHNPSSWYIWNTVFKKFKMTQHTSSTLQVCFMFIKQKLKNDYCESGKEMIHIKHMHKKVQNRSNCLPTLHIQYHHYMWHTKRVSCLQDK